ncbi:serine/threonine-protein kinase [Pseudaquabacterium terrae]|uniref:serine/threonine-protein kinase n=1 Tax=Pseudaquabacterium terrae TaxID=2732868 RepID=UPI001C251625|nr:serine/threonine-protein kinase [Aquabacterium terrae]
MPIPTRLGKYEIRRELGKGSMGVVYEGFDPLIERAVAIKVIRPDQLGPQSHELMARLKREAQAVGRLNHPGIVAIYDYGEDASVGGTSVAFIAMELIDGKELKHYFDSKHRFLPTDVARIMGEVLSALQHAHERGVTHRDIKPSNVILLRNGSIKVADFGVARLDNSQLTQAGTMIGTPMYMAPEQILGLPVDGRSDLFSCGVVLYQFLTGEKPFTGSVTSVMQRVLHDDPAPATQLNATLSPAWDTVLRKAMAKKPADRYQTASALADAIRAAAAVKGDEATVVLPTSKSGSAGGTMGTAGTHGTLGTAGLGSAGMAPVAPATRQAATASDNSIDLLIGETTVPPAGGGSGLLPPMATIGTADATHAGTSAAAGTAAAAAAAAAASAFGRTQIAPPRAGTAGGSPPASAAPPPARAPAAVPAPPPDKPGAPSWRPPGAAGAASSAAAAARSRSKTPLIAGAGALIAVLLFAGIWWARSGRTPEGGTVSGGASAPTVTPPVATVPPAPAPLPAPAPAPVEPAPAPPPVLAPAPPAVAATPAPPAADPSLASAPAPISAAPSAPAADFSADWRSRIARLEAVRTTLAPSAALALLLDANSNDERRIGNDLDTMLKSRAPNSAFALGVADGHLRFNWQVARPTPAAAQDAALKRCRELAGPAGGCATVVLNGELRRDSLLEVARLLGPQNVPTVRGRFLRTLDRALADQRAKDPPQVVAAPEPTRPAPAPTAPARPEPAARPANEWADAIAQLRANESRLNLGNAFELLLQARDPADVERLAQLNRAFKQLRWKSAMAVGERGGVISFGFGSNERVGSWAEERALADCRSGSNAPCVIVGVDGNLRPGAFIEFAGRLSGRSQTQVREAFVRDVQRALQAGIQ